VRLFAPPPPFFTHACGRSISPTQCPLLQVLEEESEYESAVARISSMDYVSTEYAIVSGVKQGVILARNPDGVAHTQTLGESNYEERDDCE